MTKPRMVTSFPSIGIEYSPKKLVAGEKTLLEISLDIPRGFHIMAHKPSEQFLIPSELTLRPLEGVSLGEPSYPEPVEEGFEWSDIKLLLYKGKVEVEVPIEIKVGNSERIAVSGVFSFQGCTENQCLLPKKQEFTLSFEVMA